MTRREEFCCPACDRPGRSKRYRVENSMLFQCRDCGTQFLVPDPDADLHKYTYWDQYKLDVHADDQVRSDYAERYESVFATVHERFGKVERVLDFGCGIGNFVEWALEHGYDAVGVELDPIGVEAARDRGLPVYLVDDFLKSHYAGWADVTCLWDVIEHVGEPLELLGTVAELTRPLGCLVIETPDVEFPVRNISLNVRRVCEWIRWSDFLYYTGHQTYFSPVGLELLLGEAGFETLTMDGELSPQEKMSRLLDIWADRRAGAGRLGPIVFDPAMKVFERLHVTNKLVATAVRVP